MKFSIITVNYNNREGLRRTIESVISQTCRDFEFIVIDGGSTDGSADVLNHYDSQITYWVSEKDSGIYNAMNKGIRHAKGDYLNFMNSGDCFYDSEVLQQIVPHLGEADIVVGRDYHFSQQKNQGHASIQPARVTMIHFFVATLDHQSSFIRRQLFDDALYREDYRLVSDWIFFTEKIVGKGSSVKFIPDIICRREEGGISEQQRDTNRKEINTFLRQYLPQGVYQDYATLAKLDRTTLYRLFEICDNDQLRKYLVYAIKFIYKICSCRLSFSKKQ